MLLQRILTAVPLAVLAVWFVLSQSSESLFYALLFFIAISAWEWSMLCGFNHFLIRIAYAVVIALAVYLTNYLIAQNILSLDGLLLVTVLWWALLIYRMSTQDPAEASDKKSLIKMLIGFITLVPPLVAMVYIHEQQGAYWLLYAVSLVWVADTGAYFSGKKFGKTKLAPRLSPGKTREGFYGASLATGLYSLLAGYYLGLAGSQIVVLLVIGFVATIYSVAGDLFISLLKRERGVKDTGAILPGHGGILDRIDSITSSAPLFVLLLGLFVFNV